MDSPHELRARAERYKQMASRITDPQALEALRELAAGYEAIAAELEAKAVHPIVIQLRND
jgi:hypothetical protein